MGSGMTARERLNARAATFFQKSSMQAKYTPPKVTSRSRAGRVQAEAYKVDKPLCVIPNFSPTTEMLTEFGNISDTPKNVAVFKVLNEGLTPDRKGHFTFEGKTYSILAVIPKYRGEQVFRWECLVGYE